MSIITLTTDFGGADWFVGSMKGIILGIAPQASIVDITHELGAGDVRGGAFALMAACRYFPRGTVHVAVVDPGVGSERPAIAARTSDYFFVGPDNGVLSFSLARERIEEVRRLENEGYFLKPVSRTFHGRDVFAPVAAHLGLGRQFSSLGSPQAEYVRLKWPQPSIVGNTLMGEVLYIDRFGNAITNIEASMVGGLGRGQIHVSVRGSESVSLKDFYGQVEPGQGLALVGSSGFVEIAVNGGNAAKQFGLKVGNPVGVG